jgi:hypothetical protein
MTQQGGNLQTAGQAQTGIYVLEKLTHRELFIIAMLQ